jgi:hypothetical protein
MDRRSFESFPAPPAVIPALLGGFNAVANHAGILLLPILFDLILWLGPRLSVVNLASSLLMDAERLSGPGQAFFTTLQDFLKGFNAFSMASTFPLGVFSLMTANLSTLSPFGERLSLTVPGLTVFLPLVLLLTVLGWVLGAFYFWAVARLVSSQADSRAVGLGAIVHGIFLAAMWSLVWLIFSVPGVIFMVILFLISPALLSPVLIILSFVALWATIPIFFSSHGIFLYGDHVLVSMHKSLRLARYAMPPLGWFVILSLLLWQGLSVLWRIPPADSWLTLLGIFGNAFVSTALLAASFIYYRDLNVWVDTVFQWVQNRTNSA